MQNKKCIICNTVIPKARLEILPDTKRCCKCSNEKPRDPAAINIASYDTVEANKIIQTPRGEL